MSERSSNLRTTAVLVVAALVFALLAYVGSFVFLVLDDEFRWGLVTVHLSQETLASLERFYLPLILVFNFFGL